MIFAHDFIFFFSSTRGPIGVLQPVPKGTCGVRGIREILQFAHARARWGLMLCGD
jgi:hypothetical protein